MILMQMRYFLNRMKRMRFLMNAWVAAAFLFSLLVALPLLVILPETFNKGDATWQHIITRLMPGYALNTTLLMAGVAILSLIMGVSTAWLTSMYHFRGRQFLSWALILPISIPAYINGFTWAGILDYTSPVYVFFRNSFGTDTGPHLFFNIHSLTGAIIIFSLSLYPYVYLITRAYFLKQSATILEASLSLGRSRRLSFFTLILPMARPAIVAGISLVMMEVLNDYGLVRYFGVDTFTTGIFTAWFAFGNASAAMRLSAFLMIIVLALILLERHQRRKLRYHTTDSHFRPLKRHALNGWHGNIARAICLVPLVAGFVIPAIMLFYWSIQTASQVVDARFLLLLRNSFLLAGLASASVVVIGLAVAFSVRTYPLRLLRVLSRISTLGYAIPGAVVAIGIMTFFLWTERWLAKGFQWEGLLLSGTWFALIYAYAVRFMAVGYNSIESGMTSISLSLDEASRSLGKRNLDTLTNIHIPLLKAPLFSALLLVFLDVLKELPLTLILRPFNFDTLAIRAFEFASDERIAEAAPAALIIMLTGMVPVYLLHRMVEEAKERKSEEAMGRGGEEARG